ncbi:hypothetical protein OPV22_033237 [Ensete ventricosum]|uniref:Phosphomannomutase n=1 Tax=Ensete ventricosum TaxID=4639 RepID=A0AAV8P345_ENSVE|nr:hypothetical protein OPV22_033237 [Ensete ventricosum]
MNASLVLVSELISWAVQAAYNPGSSPARSRRLGRSPSSATSTTASKSSSSTFTCIVTRLESGTRKNGRVSSLLPLTSLNLSSAIYDMAKLLGDSMAWAEFQAAAAAAAAAAEEEEILRKLVANRSSALAVADRGTSRAAPLALLLPPFRSQILLHILAPNPTRVSGSALVPDRSEKSIGRMAARKPDVIALFDVDGTLTAPRKVITPQMLEFMRQLREVVSVGVVGGSDLVKITEQLGKTVIHDYDYVFSENGLLAHKNGELIGRQSLKSLFVEDKLKEFINFTLHYIADLDIPIKRGTFIEFRSGMLNVSPIGRNCSQEERDEFEKYDKVHNIRQKMVSVLREKFAHMDLTFSIGGQISFDVFPRGWDKTYCLKYLGEFQEIHFFGDKTYKGGNDYEIYESELTVGHTVTSPDDTAAQCRSLFLGN